MCLTGVTIAHKNRFRGQWVATINEGLGIANESETGNRSIAKV